MKAELAKEHQWLEKFVGEWSFESEAVMAPGQPPIKCGGTEKARTLGGAWVLCEGQSEMLDGEVGTTIMTLGYDPAKQRFVGTFIGSMMTNLWIYEGQLDETGTVLTLDTEGPSFSSDGSCAGGGKLAKYQDIIEFKSDDHRVLSSRLLGEDGQWLNFMTAHYRRVK